MYNEGGGAVIGGGGAVSAGGLAYTGFSVMGFAIMAFALILTGILLWRLATVTRSRTVITMADRGFDPRAALASAVAATSGQDL